MTTTADITIRGARDADAGALRRLAALDSRRVPAGDLLVAEVGGELVAAASTTGVIADPFHLTADVVDLLEVRLDALRAPRRAAAARRPVRALLHIA
jgi:hypothetical protein